MTTTDIYYDLGREAGYRMRRGWSEEQIAKFIGRQLETDQHQHQQEWADAYSDGHHASFPQFVTLNGHQVPLRTTVPARVCDHSTLDEIVEDYYRITV